MTRVERGERERRAVRAGRLVIVGGLGWLMPGEIRVFGLEELDSAREWVASLLPDQERLY